MNVRLDFKLPGQACADVGSISMAELVRSTSREIECRTVMLDHRPVMLGELCRVTRGGANENELVLCGDTGQLAFAGRCMRAGRLLVEGDAGFGAGADLRGGEIEILGNAAGNLGVGMQSGLIRLHGCAGDWCGAAYPGQSRGMSGGMILITGYAGDCLGLGMRRGLIFVGGDAGESCAEGLLAGTVLVAGSVGRYAGRGMRRGSLVAGRMAPPLPGFRPAGQADPEWLRIYALALRRMGVALPAAWLERPLHRFTGDHLELGKGEVLIDELIE